MRYAANPWRLIALVSVLLGAVPLLVTAPAPLHDWPSHLARVWITARVLDGDEFWKARYIFQGFLIPNAALDIGILGLLRLGLGLAHAGTVFLLLVYVAFVGGFRQLAVNTGANSRLTLPFAVACFYNVSLFWGFVNFMTGLTAMLWALSLWCTYAGLPRQRTVLAVLATAAIAFCHVIAAFLFVGIVGCLDLVALSRVRRRWLPALLPSCVAAITVLSLLAASPVAEGKLNAIRYRGGNTISGLISGKVGLFVKAFLSFQIGPDMLLILAFIVLGIVVWRTRPRLALPWCLAISALVLVAIAAPEWIGENGFIDARLPAVPFVVFAATTSLRRAGVRVAAVLCGLLVARTAWLATDWHRFGEVYAALDTALAKLPPESTLLAGQAIPIPEVPTSLWWSPPISNSASLAVPHGIFVPSVFASGVQQPLVLRPAWESWRSYRDINTASRLAAVLAEAHAGCHPVTNLFMLYPTDVLLSDATPGRLPGLLGRRFALISVC